VNAVGANQRAFDLAVKVGADALQVWPPRTFAFVVRVTHAIADGSALTANFTNPRHLKLLSFQ
jgi:hypothetical protein